MSLVEIRTERVVNSRRDKFYDIAYKRIEICLYLNIVRLPIIGYHVGKREIERSVPVINAEHGRVACRIAVRAENVKIECDQIVVYRCVFVIEIEIHSRLESESELSFYDKRILGYDLLIGKQAYKLCHVESLLGSVDVEIDVERDIAEREFFGFALEICRHVYINRIVIITYFSDLPIEKFVPLCSARIVGNADAHVCDDSVFAIHLHIHPDLRYCRIKPIEKRIEIDIYANERTYVEQIEYTFYTRYHAVDVYL